MIIKAQYDGGSRWVRLELRSCPRQGEYVDLKDGVRRFVSAVIWDKAPEEGFDVEIQLEEGIAP